MRIKRVNLINMYFFLTIFFVFTNFVYNIQSIFIIGLTCLLVVIKSLSETKMTFNMRDFIFILFSILFVIGALYSSRYNDAIKLAIPFMFLTISMILLSKENKMSYNKIIKYILFFSSIHVISTILYQLFPQQVQKILPYFLGGENLTRNLYEFNNNHINCGITPIQSINAFYISCFIMIVFVNLLKEDRRKIINTLMLILGVVALFLTSKRGLLLANVAAIIFVIFYDKYKNKKINLITIIKIAIVTIFLLFIGYTIVSEFFSDALRIFTRFSQKDITTGRAVIYSTVFSYYKNGNIIIGNGLLSSRDVLSVTLGEANDVHNIYLQILAELGIVGIVSFLITIFMIFMRMIKIKLNKENNKYILITVYFIIMFFIYGLTGNGLFDLTISTLYYLMIGLLFIDLKGNGEENESRNFDIS